MFTENERLSSNMPHPEGSSPSPAAARAGSGVHLLADGAVLPPYQEDENELNFFVPIRTAALQLVSPSFRAGGGDIRQLGVIVSGLAVSDGSSWRQVELTDPNLRAGFHLLERENGKAWRWTNGNAHMSPHLWDGLKGAVLLRLTGQFSGFAAR